MTSVSDAEAHNFGRAEHYDHATRYDRAAEYLDVVRWLTGFDGSRTIKVGDPMPNFRAGSCEWYDDTTG
ncbi:alkanesulfonate monooxygenase SsuD/methylene tetrahydromethanopterin reductase-like flavin-dependent oxidoreductase (luciferase family) [Sphingomonas faeni]|nr:alkanesulfonate monooxygenase SsuD/methylene tetrahydromethanopterin reductase-like flavin-dependent oxidoreductase (luciferase family) [Sphingomonas faeni]